MKRLICLVGPTCSGKSTLERELKSRGYPALISFTTRDPRSGEDHGVHYEFLTPGLAELWIKQGRVAQWVNFEGNYYGTTQDALEEAFAASDIAVVVVEPTGVTQFREYAKRTGMFEVVPVYINGAFEQLVTRLVHRYRTDRNANPAYYWSRLAQQHDAYHDWPSYIDNWTLVIDQVDDDIPGKTVVQAADAILNTITR